ncbi:enoyl-CoA hydratase [Ramlibacter algicola]|jgi:enoyl-CoA hydratase|uniref:Enoyl-CoA hydratase n=1 Tax=Ramlibacter algicola TaxID=2795217 RepID=A0A934Q353_9BURK|nr:enoyl-CoA hydratase [Ramlibacter algicola]MBK0393707.1 enoyl-CoA hydratase [Ramlibacter algicola]
MSESLLLIEQAGAVRRIWLNRPEARNAQSQQMLDQLDAAFRDAQADAATRVVVLAAKGPHFSAGHDLKQAQAERAEFTVEERWAYEQQHYFDYCMRIWDFPKPTIAQVQGACVAAGLMVANMCDLVVAADDAFFSDPVTHTLGAAATEVLIHPWVLGLRQAKELLFTGERFSAVQAREMGMVNRVVPAASLDDETMALAQRIAKAPPFAMQVLKKSLNRSVDVQGMRQALSSHFDVHQLSHVTEEYKRSKNAGLASAIQKGAKA